MKDFILPKIPYCFKEKKKFKLFEYPKLNNSKFWKIKKKFKNKKFKVLFISGPARHGNHLLLSLLDGNSQIPFIPGEDDTLRSFFSHINKNQVKTINKIKNTNFGINLSCQNYTDKTNLSYNKWKKLSKAKIHEVKYWSGLQPNNEGPLIDYRDFIPNIDYKSFEKTFLKQKKNSFFEFWYSYMNSYNKLNKNNKKKKLKYNFYWFGSGLRRELFYILNQTENIKILTPIRNFPEFYNSYCLPRFGRINYNKKILKDGWEHWKHKVIDYMILKKRYPKNIELIKYDDLIYNTEVIVRKICKKLEIRFSKKNLYPTIFNKLIHGNSSDIKNNTVGKIYFTKSSFDKRYLPKSYFSILKEINKLKL